jgi:hypothetical protein
VAIIDDDDDESDDEIKMPPFDEWNGGLSLKWCMTPEISSERVDEDGDVPMAG